VKLLTITATALMFVALGAAIAQTTEPPPQTTDSGEVLFSRGADSKASAEEPTPALPAPLGKDDTLGVTDSERSSLTFTTYDLDAHLTPATSSIAMRAGLVVRNDSSAPLSRVVLQISSTLRWQVVSLGGRALPLVSRLIDTDADHTGAMNEAVVTLPQPLAPGATVNLTTLYAGTISISAERLERTGAPPAKARAADWDTIGRDGTFLRGFGYVLWYPVSAPPLMFRDGDRLFQFIGHTRLREASAPVRLRLAIEYQGEPPDAAFFCGRRETLKAISDNQDEAASEAPGIAVAQFAPEPLGFRTPDLFVTTHPAIEAGPPSTPGLLSAVTTQESALSAYSSASAEVEPMLSQWFGPGLQSSLYLIDHSGQPFEDDALVVRHLAGSDQAEISMALAHSLTHAWIHSRYPWIEEGLAEFSQLLWAERKNGREAAIAAVQDAYRNLARVEATSVTGAGEASAASLSSSSDSSNSAEIAASPRENLINATSEVFYRTKAAAVWWMLRSIVGDQALQQALQAYRSDPRADRAPEGFEHTVEKLSHKDLRWFFNDWVYRDGGLPHLSIASVAPSELKGRTGMPDGWLIAVEVRNDGDAVADVPVTVRSTASTQLERLRIPARSSATTRIVFPGTPDEVIVNDGSAPESGPTTHTRKLTLAAK
jgi:hypothetical protein